MAVLAKPLPREASEALNVLTPTKGSAEFECLEVFLWLGALGFVIDMECLGVSGLGFRKFGGLSRGLSLNHQTPKPALLRPFF